MTVILLFLGAFHYSNGIALMTLRRWSVIPHDLQHRLHDANPHDHKSKHHTHDRRHGPPAATAELDVTQRRQDIRERTRARRANQLKHSAEIADQQTDKHARDDEGRTDSDMEGGTDLLALAEVVEEDFAADEGLEGEGGEHVEAEAEAGEVDEGVGGGEVVEDVALGFVAEGEEAGEGHGEAGEEGDEGADVRDEGEAVQGWGFEGAVDEEGVVVADECEGDDTDGLENAAVDCP